MSSITFLERLDLTDDERRRLTGLGSSHALLTPEERASLDEPPPRRFSLGAQLDPPPRLRNRG